MNSRRVTFRHIYFLSCFPSVLLLLVASSNASADTFQGTIVSGTSDFNFKQSVQTDFPLARELARGAARRFRFDPSSISFLSNPSPFYQPANSANIRENHDAARFKSPQNDDKARNSPVTVLILDLNNADRLWARVQSELSSDFKLVFAGAAASGSDRSQEFANLIEVNRPNVIVISGHSSGTEFSGVHGRFDVEDVLQTGLDFKDRIGLILRGCYSLTIDKILQDSPYMRAFPNLHYVVGYTDRAWSSERDEAFDFMSFALQNVHQPARTPQNLLDWDGRMHSEVAVYAKNADSERFVATHYGSQSPYVLDMREANHKCRESVGKVPVMSSTFQRYDRQSNIDQDMHTRLRRFYSWNRRNEYCRLAEWSSTSRFTNPDWQIRSLYRHNIVRNFFHWFPESYISSAIQSAGKSLHLFCNDCYEELMQSRELQLDFPDLLSDADNACLNNSSCTDMQLRNIRMIKEAYYKLVVSHDPGITPLQWAVDENAGFYPPLLMHAPPYSQKTPWEALMP